MVLITREEVILREYDLDTQIRTVHFHEMLIEVDVVTCVMETWLIDNQKECMEGLMWTVLTGI